LRRARTANAILELAAGEFRSQGDTWIVPGHGRLSDSADVASYRNMVVIVRDRVKGHFYRADVAHRKA
jgi:hypothetical protein